ncbi:MAG: PorV/PorQ family protein [Calditrichae bacterium]|nr:PorV/PorQ family protein [Calditrichota bacterium]MCB9059015.1 PorV/PorQ family protein [Calditrichia bacterium]
MKYRLQLLIPLMILVLKSQLLAQNPYRVGTTAANFLEIGYDAKGTAMGDAYVCRTEDISSIYWNPAGLAFMEKPEVQFLYQPWIADINTSFVGAGIILPGIGTLGLSIIGVNYGFMDVTTLADQEGTGERFDASEYAFSFAFARQLTDRFAIGATFKYITSRIWSTNASAIATDLGVTIKTGFFSWSGSHNDGLRIGMSISNYGSRMQYDGLNLNRYDDPEPDDAGNYAYIPSKYDLSEWELPLIIRVGILVKALKLEHSQLSVEVNALHPNNNAESVNLGMEYAYNVVNVGKFFLRSGYKALWMPDSEYGITFGAGCQLYIMENTSLKIDFSYRSIGILGNIACYSVGMEF